MTDEPAPTVEQLLDEVESLRQTGLASFDVSGLAKIGRLAVEARYCASDDVSVEAIRRFVTTAVGMLDQDRYESSAACLLGISEVSDLSASLSDRVAAAASACNVKVRAYNGSPPRGHKSSDIRSIADCLVSVHRKVVRQDEVERRRRDGMPPTPELVSVEPPEAVSEHLEGAGATEWLMRRQKRSTELWQQLLAERDRELAAFGPLSTRLCVFASGSYGRDEAMEYSDLDLFLVDDVPGDDPTHSGPLNKFELGLALTLIDRARAGRGIQRFSQGGYYQEPQSFRRMLPDPIRHTQLANDDRHEGPTRLTTARALLLANSKCFANDGLYVYLRTQAMDDYWRDHVGNRRPLIPTYLINDLRRLWLTMLIDFEHFYPKELVDGRRMSGSTRKIAGLKLALPQKLGCYSPILAMLERSGDKGLLRADAEEVLDMTTRQRLDMLAESNERTISVAANALRELYGQYLAFNWCDKQDMADRVNTRDWSQVEEHFSKASTLILLMLWTYHARIPEVARLALV